MCSISKSYKTLLISVSIVFLQVFISCESEDEVIFGEGVFTTVVGTSSIEGELFLPEGKGPFPVLIAVEGSGNEDRASTEPFAPIFNSFGYGLYIYDKRGIGGSTGVYPTETVENPFDFLAARAQDVSSIIQLLQKHHDIEKGKIGLFAASQGTWVSTMIYEEMTTDINVMIFASGGAASTGEEQFYESLIADGYSVEESNQMISEYNGEIGYDPKSVLKSCTIETLFLFGGRDMSHPTLFDEEVVTAMAKPNFTIYSFGNANHSLFDVDTEEFPQDLFSKINDWLSLQK
ncbi:alpha/beta hydrolase family protein [Reichenbachiella sp.]|uniref:alpha/beta hydrolase family protein n=1 Tax=Reichenbachiella sp. TaxID=2184521 RepID=UPI003BAF38CE